MNVIPFPKRPKYHHLDPQTVEVIRKMWGRPESSLKKFAPNVEKVLRLLNEQAKDERVAAQR